MKSIRFRANVEDALRLSRSTSFGFEIEGRQEEKSEMFMQCECELGFPMQLPHCKSFLQ
jgi:hypothetical protein